MKLALKRFGAVAITGALVSLPAALFAGPRLNAPLWYTLLSLLISAVGMGVLALACGGVVLIAGRNRSDGGLKIALIVTSVVGVLSSYAVITAALSQR